MPLGWVRLCLHFDINLPRYQGLLILDHFKQRITIDFRATPQLTWTNMAQSPNVTPKFLRSFKGLPLPFMSHGHAFLSGRPEGQGLKITKLLAQNDDINFGKMAWYI